MIIFLLLYFNFRNVTAPLIVMLSIPFALIGGIWLVYWYGFNLSVAVAVGFIALAGVAAEIGVLVLTFINHEVTRRRHAKIVVPAEAAKTDGSVLHHTVDPAQARLTSDEIMSAVLTGTAERVRPITMTAVAVISGLLPIMVGSGTGSSVMQRIAAPMVGGMITTTILCLLVLPVIYGLVLQAQEFWRFRK